MDPIDIGLRLSESPFGWIAALGAPIVAIGIAIKVWTSDWTRELRILVVVAAVVFIMLELPTVARAYFAARDACRAGRAPAAACTGLPGV